MGTLVKNRSRRALPCKKQVNIEIYFYFKAYVWEKWFYLIEPYATHIPYMIGVGNHEYDHTTGGEHDPSHAKGPGGFRPIWFNGNDDSGGECGVPMYYRFHMPDTGHSIWWYEYILCISTLQDSLSNKSSN